MRTQRLSGLNYRERGFTLLELALVIVAAAAAVMFGLPAWQQHKLRLHRAEARAELVSTAQRLSGCYAQLHVYDNPACTVTLPETVADNTFELRGQITAGSFALQAHPVGELADDVDCGELRLDHRQQRSVSGRLPVAECW
jgi:type IV pilus assembly protein PilE